MKKITHVLAVIYAAAAAFAVSDAGKALIAQYPRLTALTALLALIGSLYHSPKAPQ